MHRYTHIPIEIASTVIAVAELGSLTKAALKLDLSQPAVTSQIKRIERIVGGAVFAKTPNGSELTELGKTVVRQARRMVEATSQLMALGGSAIDGPEQVHLGLSSILVRSFMSEQTPEALWSIQTRSDNSSAIARALVAGQLDVAVFYMIIPMPEITPMIVAEMDTQLAWVRAKQFVFKEGEPIPIVTWTSHDVMARALSEKAMTFRIVFNGEDYDAKLSAVERGIGISALPRHLIPQPLIEANEHYLPSLPIIKTVLCVRPGVSSDAAMKLKRDLGGIFFAGASFKRALTS